VRDPVQEDLSRGRLGSLNGVPLRVSVQEYVQFRHLGNPTAVDLPVELYREPHGPQLTTNRETGRCLVG
jgi:hypothetical protein